MPASAFEIFGIFVQRLPLCKRLLREFEIKEKVLQSDFEGIFSNFLKVCTNRERK